MKIKKDLNELVSEAEKISKIEECRTCQCFYDMLVEFKGVLKKEEAGGDMASRLEEIVEKARYY